MKCVSIKARLAVFTVFFAVPLVVAQPVDVDTTKEPKSITKQFTSTSEIDKKTLNDVLGTIKQELKQSDGDAYIVECTYKMHNNKPISALTKTYHKGYRRKATRSEINFSSNHHNKKQTQTIQPNQIIEVIYKPSIYPNKVSVIKKNPSNPNCRLGKSKTVNLVQPLLA